MVKHQLKECAMVKHQKRIWDGETSAKRLQDNMAKMVKHQRTRGENITPNNDI